MKSRPDRWERCLRELGEDIIRIDAIYHGDIDIELLRPRISRFFPASKIPKVSHQQVYRRIILLNEPCVVFEDDVAFVNKDIKEYFLNFDFSFDFDIIFLNGNISDKPGCHQKKEFKIIDYNLTWKTTESYIISPKLANLFLDLELGAIDAHILNFLKTNKVKAFCVDTPVFCQYNRQDNLFKINSF